MSARWNRAARVGETPAGAGTTHTYIAGIGASGALLAGAGVALISLVGLVSFDVWPGTPPGPGPEEAQLNFGGGTVSQPAGGTPLSAASGLLASASPEGAGDGPPAGGPGGSKKQPAPKGDRPAPPAQTPTPPFVPAPVESDPRTGNQGTGKTVIKTLPKGGKPRKEPLDNEDETDPREVLQKILPGRPTPVKVGSGSSDSSSSSGRGSSGSSRGGSRRRPSRPPSQSAPSNSSSGSGSGQSSRP